MDRFNGFVEEFWPPTIVGTGLRLGCLEGVMNAERLIDEIHRKESSTDAEQTAGYVLRTYDPAASVEL
jgi:hypothetical protein